MVGLECYEGAPFMRSMGGGRRTCDDSSVPHPSLREGRGPRFVCWLGTICVEALRNVRRVLEQQLFVGGKVLEVILLAVRPDDTQGVNRVGGAEAEVEGLLVLR